MYSIFTIINLSSCETTFNLECNYDDHKLTPTNIDVYRCEATNEIVLKERYIKKGTATGKLAPGKTLADVTGLHAYFKTINFLPDFTTVFPNLIGLSLDMCKVLKLTKDELKPYPKIVHLHLHANKLRVLEKDLFMYNPDLIYIRLSHNMLREIDPQVFDSLKSLKYLYFKGNECTQKDCESPKEIAELVKTLDDECVIKYRPAPVSRPREERKRVVKEKTSIWKTFGITFGTFGGIVVAVGIFYLVRKLFLQ
ncbi:unnamed protein product [Chironomus riparius]|uniref:Uncharacterized protein n=1 Tax=Chironomus riparius TaxID=315576 RepID=A0A9N9WYU8_9DIPT|nr:unnamed protein product [Chironomus riparius]